MKAHIFNQQLIAFAIPCSNQPCSRLECNFRGIPARLDFASLLCSLAIFILKDGVSSPCMRCWTCAGKRAFLGTWMTVKNLTRSKSQIAKFIRPTIFRIPEKDEKQGAVSTWKGCAFAKLRKISLLLYIFIVLSGKSLFQACLRGISAL